MSFDPLRAYTQARIGLGHQAPALPTTAWLRFAYHHACATDAVHMPWAIDDHARELQAHHIRCKIIKTKAHSREMYLMRPDYGRNLDEKSQIVLKQFAHNESDVVIVLSNGLSSPAVAHHATAFLRVLLQQLAIEHIKVSTPVFLVENARVALIDHVGDLLGSNLGLIILGERPGLSAADSLALYLTYRPRRGLSDAARNCVSNIRPPHGLDYDTAALKARYLVSAALQRKISGIALKEEAHVLP